MLSLEDVIALNDEVTLLAQAGVPLDAELATVGRNQRHELTRINAAVARRVGRGESLTEAVAVEDDALPTIYQHVVEAGLRGGRLPLALEGLCDHWRWSATLKRQLTQAMVYPLVIAVLAYIVFVAILVFQLPVIVDAYRELDVGDGSSLRLILGARKTLPYWGPVPIILLAWIGLLWLAQRRHPTLGSNAFTRPLRGVPWLRNALADGNRANIAALAALMMEHDIPEDDSVRLAFGSAGSSRGLAPSVSARRKAHDRSSPLLSWALSVESDGNDSDAKVEALRVARDFYRRRASERVRRLQRWFPVAALIVIGGGMTLLTVVTGFAPFFHLLLDLA